MQTRNCKLPLVVMILLSTTTTFGDTFGTGLNTFDVEFVNIGDAGNVADTTGTPNPAGSVGYGYRIGKFEIREDAINKANLLGGLGLTHDNRGPNMPATRLSWLEAARFVNWLNVSSGYSPAYKFDQIGKFRVWSPSDPGYDSTNGYRNRGAKYFLPSVHEWYKAAYYDPQTDQYYNYPTGSDIAPDGFDFSGDTAFDAVFFDGYCCGGPRDVTDVGLPSPYGTVGQGGNIAEWLETDLDGINDSQTSLRGIRGGYSNTLAATLASNLSGNGVPSYEEYVVGFRIASIAIPEPSAIALLSLGVVCLLRRKWTV